MLAATYGPTMIVCGGTSGVPWPLAYQYYNAWSACEKLAWQVPRATHTYFVDQMLSCGMDSMKVDTMARYVKFVRGLIASPSMEVAVMCGVARQDIRTVTGGNLALLRRKTGLDMTVASVSRVREVLQRGMAIVPEPDQWRMKYLARLLTKRGEAHYMSDEEGVIRLSSLIDILCCN